MLDSPDKKFKSAPRGPRSYLSRPLAGLLLGLAVVSSICARPTPAFGGDNGSCAPHYRVLAGVPGRFADQPKLAVTITGPTSVGKTAVVRELIAATDGNVVNADIMYFYGRDFAIGTGLADSFALPKGSKHLYEVRDPHLPPPTAWEYREAVEKVLGQVDLGKPVIFDGNFREYMDTVRRGLPNMIRIGLMWPKNLDIRSAIRSRVDKAIAGGLLEETRNLVSKGLDNTPPFLQSPVYSVVNRHLKGELSLQEMKDAITTAGVSIAERQYKKLKTEPNVIWVESDLKNPRKTAQKILQILAERAKSVVVPVERAALNEETDIETFRVARGLAPSQMEGSPRDGFDLLMRRYNEAYPQHAGKIDDYLAGQTLELSPGRTEYFNVVRKGSAPSSRKKVVGFGAVFDGSAPVEKDGRMPLEMAMEGLPVRTTAEGKPTPHVEEVMRFSTATGEAGVGDLMAGVAGHLERRYGSLAAIPEDHIFVGQVEDPTPGHSLLNHYLKAGFTVKFSPAQTGVHDRWVLQFPGRALYERYHSVAPGAGE